MNDAIMFFPFVLFFFKVLLDKELYLLNNVLPERFQVTDALNSSQDHILCPLRVPVESTAISVICETIQGSI